MFYNIDNIKSRPYNSYNRLDTTYTSRKFGLSPMTNTEISLDVPAMLIWTLKRRCIAVVVKKDNMIIKFVGLGGLVMQYFAKASNALSSQLKQ
jgi:hypothetical protein